MPARRTHCGAVCAMISTHIAGTNDQRYWNSKGRCAIEDLFPKSLAYLIGSTSAISLVVYLRFGVVVYIATK